VVTVDKMSTSQDAMRICFHFSPPDCGTLFP
jgi:hypothetical protein